MWEPEFLEHVIILIKYKRKIGDLLKMGVLDKFLSIMKLDDGDDEYDEDEFFDDDEYDDDYEEKPKRSLFHKNTKDNDKDFDEDDEDDYTAPVKSKSAFSNNKVTPMRQPSRRSSVNMEVCVIKPTSVEDSREITETLLSGRTVILNLEGLDLEIAQRIIDFTSGAKEESMLQKRLVELSRLAYNRGIVIFSDFLNLNELNILHTTPKDMFLSQYKTYGGYDLSERQMAVFLPDALYYDYEYPIQIIEVTPSSKRFAEDLTHRDYLGALMNLGIERSKVGDIIVEDQKGLIFVKEELAEYIADNLTVVRHTNVNTSIGKGVKVDYEPRFEELKGTVSSIRLDSVLALAYPLSRSKITAQIEAGKVFVNGKLITSNGYRLKDNDIISVRKMGRIAYDGILSETKKGRYLISVRKYI